uniref:Uncharacterized protein n=1 Tax=Candidatus Kentrum sp. DK TaxID=2126562 RepID=A0A450RU54_9GAMM|nr:MAG: hypothetical protein BECKDK2373C_GA0170839_100194 [Candidatus Kentron sp. DK]
MPPRGKRAASCARRSRRRSFLMHHCENSETLALYAKRTLHSLTALKMASECSATKCKLRFPDHFYLVMKHNSSFAVASLFFRYVDINPNA